MVAAMLLLLPVAVGGGYLAGLRAQAGDSATGPVASQSLRTSPGLRPANRPEDVGAGSFEKRLARARGNPGDAAALWEEIRGGAETDRVKLDHLAALIATMAAEGRMDEARKLIEGSFGEGESRWRLMCELIARSPGGLAELMAKVRSDFSPQDQECLVRGMAMKMGLGNAAELLADFRRSGVVCSGPEAQSLGAGLAANIDWGGSRMAAFEMPGDSREMSVTEKSRRYREGLAQLELMKSGFPEAKAELTDGFLMKATYVDPEKTLETFLLLKEDLTPESRKARLAAMLQETVVVAPRTAAEALVKLGAEDRHEGDLSEVAYNWMISDAAAAKDWAQQHRAAVSAADFGDYSRGVIDILLARGDADGARSWQAQIEDPASREKAAAAIEKAAADTAEKP